MADQATMTGNGPATARSGIAVGGDPGRSPARGGNGAGPIAVVSNLAEFGEDLLNLAELQARLAAIELKENIEATKYGAVALLAGSMLALGTLPVLLTGIAELLDQYALDKRVNVFVRAANQTGIRSAARQQLAERPFDCDRLVWGQNACAAQRTRPSDAAGDIVLEEAFVEAER